MTKRKRTLTGALAKPIVISNKATISRSILDSDEEFKHQIDKYKQEGDKIYLEAKVQQLQKIPLLFKHYKISEDDDHRWCELALALACEYVDGFQIIEKKKLGRVKIWNDEAYAFLYFLIEKRMEESKKSIRKLNVGDVCSALIKKEEPWKSMAIKAKALQNKYAIASDLPLVTGLRKMFDLVPDDNKAEKKEVLEKMIEIFEKQSALKKVSQK